MGIMHGRGFIDWLEKAGVIPNNTRSVIIEAGIDRVTTIHCNMLMDSKAISEVVPEELKAARVVVNGSASDANEVVDMKARLSSLKRLLGSEKPDVDRMRRVLDLTVGT